MKIKKSLLGVDWNISWSVTGESHLRSLFIGFGDLATIWRSLGILTDWSLTPHVSKVPDSVSLAPHHIVILGRLTNQSESLILATKEETGLVDSVNKVSVVCTRNWGWDSTVNSWASAISYLKVDYDNF